MVAADGGRGAGRAGFATHLLPRLPPSQRVFCQFAHKTDDFIFSRLSYLTSSSCKGVSQGKLWTRFQCCTQPPPLRKSPCPPRNVLWTTHPVLRDTVPFQRRREICTRIFGKNTEGDKSKCRHAAAVLTAQPATQRSHSVQKSIHHGCQMAIARFLDRMCLALRASGLWLRYAMLQNRISSFPFLGLRQGGGCGSARKGRDQILPSGNLGVLPFRFFLPSPFCSLGPN